MSSPVRVKICGITRPQDAAAAAAEGAWAVGLVFYPPSPRFVGAVQARAISSALPGRVLRVGVFKDQGLDDIRAVARAVPLDLFQIQGAGSARLCRLLGPRRCVQVLTPKRGGSRGGTLRSRAAYVLLDRPRRGARPVGGPVDRALARRIAARRPRTILAGGLTPENVGAAVRAAAPWAVDVSSGVESAPGIKDRRKIRAFIAAARGGA